MVTHQEITNFINQPTPRKIPKNILHAVENKNSHKLFLVFKGLLIFSVLLLTLSLFFEENHILLNILSNKVQGVIIGWERIEKQETKISYYRMGISYPTPNGELTASCYVDFKENIPGWGQIPESLNDQASNDFVRLSTPFPVIVEYATLSHYVARAVGTRSTPNADYYILSLIQLTLGFLMILFISIVDINIHLQNDKQLLTKGYFTTGHVCEPKKQNLLLIIVSVWFNDQLGKRQTGMCIVRTKRDKEKCRQLYADDRPVGLMYLPDRLYILITDLLLTDDLTEARGRN